MKADELSFANQQLAGMLRAGIPLEGALRQLCSDMKHGDLREELTLLEKDLAQGVPLNKALEQRKLPAFYRTLMSVGQAGGDLPGTLLMVADHYQRQHSLRVRLGTLVVYPIIIVTVSFVVSLLLAFLFGPTGLFLSETQVGLQLANSMTPWPLRLAPWLSILAPGLCVLLLLGFGVALSYGPARAWLQWHLPGFRDARLAMIAEMFSLLLSRNFPLSETVKLLRGLERGQPLDAELKAWEGELESGSHRIQEVTRHGQLFPPLFVWLVATGGEDWAAGFQRASQVYNSRAHQRIEMALYAFLPIATLFLGILVFVQIYPVLTGIVNGFHSTLDY